MFSITTKHTLALFATIAAKIALALFLIVPAIAGATTVRMQFPQGTVDITLYDTTAPRTVANFLSYVNSSAYRNAFIHRSVPNFVIQGGGFTWNDASGSIAKIATTAAVANEFSTTRLNKRGTIAMARLGGSPDSATSQWFINLVDNPSLDTADGGFTVFGEVTAATLPIVDAIAALPLVNADADDSGTFATLPVVGTVANNTLAKANLVLSSNVSIVSGTTATNYQGMWWNAAESGWGMNITQHNTIIFAAMYTYDDAGLPTWYVIPNCPVTTNGCTGDMYKVTGGTSPAVAWNGSAKITTKVGTGTLTFASTTAGTFAFTINGVSGTKAITPQVFSSDTPAIDYSDMWWNPNESGWGISVTQQGSIIFAAWYAYDATGKAIWYVAPNCTVTGTTCTSRLYKVTGGESLNALWNGTNPAEDVGSLAFSFTTTSAATMTYTLNGVSSNRLIVRQAF
ncbi:MAG: peptidylprolyl isomerase [Betaproteobacteria bacterium]